VTQPEAGSVRTGIRRRRSRRHHRNRLIRRFLIVLVFGFFVGSVSVVALRHFSPSLFRSRAQAVPDIRDVEASRERVVLANIESYGPIAEARPIYPYSVVPGGVSDARELKWVAEHDPIVAAHYAGFDYEHARVVRLVLARTAYVSYRIGNHVYWTRRRITLHKGEKVITDGKITARARCANRVEDLPQQANSELEPPAGKFEAPLRLAAMAAIEGPPVPFISALLNPPGVADIEPTLPLWSLFAPLSNGRWVPLELHPLLQSALCAPGKKGKEAEAASSKGKKKKGACGNSSSGGGAIVPEAETWLLVASGLAGVFWKVRKVRRKPASA
jgi:hypothetical protein